MNGTIADDARKESAFVEMVVEFQKRLTNLAIQEEAYRLQRSAAMAQDWDDWVNQDMLQVGMHVQHGGEGQMADTPGPEWSVATAAVSHAAAGDEGEPVCEVPIPVTAVEPVPDSEMDVQETSQHGPELSCGVPEPEGGPMLEGDEEIRGRSVHDEGPAGCEGDGSDHAPQPDRNNLSPNEFDVAATLCQPDTLS